MKPFIINILPNDTILTQELKPSFYVEIDGKCCTTEADFHSEVSSKLKFPEYYGNNLDALFDCLIDLEWIEERNVILQFVNFEYILSEEKSKDYFLSTLLLVLSDICSSVEEIKSLEYSEKIMYFFINYNEEAIGIMDELEIKYEFIS
ncbi:MAG: barstar family protein [Saprospiraceae bacterium]